MNRNPLDDLTTELRQRKLSRTQKDALWTSIEAKLDALPGESLTMPRPKRARTYFGAVGAALAVASLTGVAAYGILHEPKRPSVNQPVATEPPKNPEASLTLPVVDVRFIHPPDKWFGIRVVEGTWESNTPVSEDGAMPLGSNFGAIVNHANTKIHSLSESRKISNFPIHGVKGVNGWTRTFSEGVELPVLNYFKGKYTGMTWKPVQYYDIYTSGSAQTIAITQTLESEHNYTIALLPYKPGAKCLGGFGDNLAFLYEDKDDDLKELTIYSVTSKNQVTKIVVDGTSVEYIVAFAKLYLSAPTE